MLDNLNGSPGMRRVLTKIGSVWGTFYVELGTSRIVRHHGFENFSKIDQNRGVLLVANHRTFYDLFVITARLFRLFGAHHNIYFPVRSTFFYDNFLGLPVNLFTALGGMYPPIIRDKKRRSWNKFATDLMVELLKKSENMIGFHPEGTRNRGPDPYNLLRAKPGCGELIYRAQPNVVPVFLQGFPSRFWVLLRKNLNKSRAKKPIVHMVMGEPMDFSEELEREANMKTYLHISQKVMHRIEELSREEKEIRAGFKAQTAEAVL
ncbi:1-acyl-sn-glycerol-3-phosphate acyltransferase [bacterium]|nr:1-acyl-sn-glycerol-3-phosphate acyltransferase [bacterium]